MPENQQSSPATEPLLKRWWAMYLSNRRRIGTVAAVVFAIFFAWHVVTGRNGLNNWQHKRAEDKSLALEIDQLTQENTRLSEHVDRLKSDPGAIEYEARERLHYARPNEMIYALPAKPAAPRPVASMPVDSTR